MLRATTWRERRWLAGRILPLVLLDRSVWCLGLLGSSLLLLAGTIGLVAEGPPPLSTILGVAAGGGVLLSASIWIVTRRITGAELVQQLLRLDRCGCCGHRKSTPACLFEPHRPRATRRFTCTECGSSWAGGHVDFDEDRYSEAA